MRDLQHRLSALGYDLAGAPAGRFEASTAGAVRAFQDRRGLPQTGICDVTTWEALVEAGWHLGDRPLYRTVPMLRGDDVADLQRRLNALGFDAGRVDGIFGPLAEHALADFQRNVGLVADAVCGPATVGALSRLGDRHLAPASVADVRERERFRCGPRTLAGHRILVAHHGGLDALASGSARALVAAGADAVVLQHPDGSEVARQANELGADALLFFALAGPGVECRVAYFRSPAGWESATGHDLARGVLDAFAPLLPCNRGRVAAMSVPVLRETRMPAVLVELATAHDVVGRTGELAGAVPQLCARWVERLADG